MSKLTSHDCKKAIIAYLTQSVRQALKAEFTDSSEHEMIDTETLNVNNWKRQSKAKVSFASFNDIPIGSIERVFDCQPFDDQLRAYVYTNKDDSAVIKIRVQGE